MSLWNFSRLSTPQNREEKQIARHERFAIRLKSIIMFRLLAKHAQKFFCLTLRHRWRPRVSCLWGDRDDYMETTNLLSRPDRLEIFWNDWGDWDDPDDHMETRLNFRLRSESETHILLAQTQKVKLNSHFHKRPRGQKPYLGSTP